MTNFYTNVEQEITDFIQQCHDCTTSVSQSSISCLTTNSFDVFTYTNEHFDSFLNFISTYTLDMSIEYEEIISILSNCSDLVNYINTYQYLFIEYALDDYLSLDEHFDSIFSKSLRILHQLHQLPTITSDIYKLEKVLLLHLPSTYAIHYPTSISTQITSTLIDQTARLFSSTYNSLSTETGHEDDDHDCIISSSFLFSSFPLSIQTDKNHSQTNDIFDQSRSLLQLDKINLRTTILTHSQLTPSFQFDFFDFEEIENDLKTSSNWIAIEREFMQKILSIWSSKDLFRQTINPWSSDTFWTLIMNFKCSDMNLKYEFILLIQWSFCLLTIQAFNRDWDLFFSKTLINTIISNHWRTVCFDSNICLSLVGYNLNQMFLRLTRISSILQYMKILSDQSSYLTSFCMNIISTEIDNLRRRIEGTFHILFIWIRQNADTFINGNALERTLIICQSDQIQLSKSITDLIDSLRQLNNCEQMIKSINKLHASCQIINNETISKLYKRIQLNTSNHFNQVLPDTAMDWRTDNQQASYMIVACEKLLKSVISQCECLNMEKKLDIYENILLSFIQTWTSTLLEKKYRFTDEMVLFLQKDYEYLQTFLSTTIADQKLVASLVKSSAMQQLLIIINLLQTGEKNGSISSFSPLPNQDKWLRSRKSSSPIAEFFQYACCCQRRNRVTTDPI